MHQRLSKLCYTYIKRKEVEVNHLLFYALSLFIIFNTSVSPLPKTESISRRIKATFSSDIGDAKNLNPEIHRDRIVYYSWEHKPQFACNLTGDIVEIYFYDKNGNLSYIEIKNPKNNDWIHLKPIVNQNEELSGRFIWTVYQEEIYLGGVTISIDQENNSMYIGRIEIHPEHQRKGIGKTVIDFLFNYYKRLPQYRDLKSISAHTYNPALAEIFLQLSTDGKIAIENSVFRREQLIRIVKEAIKKAGIWVKFQTPNGEIKAFEIAPTGRVVNSDIPELEGEYVLRYLKAERDKSNRWNIYIQGENFGLVDRFANLLRIEAEIDY